MKAGRKAETWTMIDAFLPSSKLWLQMQPISHVTPIEQFESGGQLGKLVLTKRV